MVRYQTSLVLPLSLGLVFNPCRGHELAAQERFVVVTGSVTDSSVGESVPLVSVVFEGREVAKTNKNGDFETGRLNVTGSAVTLAFRRIGYEVTTQEIEVPSGVTLIDVAVQLSAWPTRLEDIEVRGERYSLRNPGLVGFYRRYGQGYGRYLTEPQIQRSKGFDLLNYMRRLRVIDPADVSVFEPAPTICSDRTPFVSYLDGVRMEFEDINRIIFPGELAGIEVYANASAVRLPGEFIPAGPYCGIAMFWTREPRPPSPVEVGGYFSAQAAVNGASRERIGAQVLFPLRSASSLRLHVAFDFALDDLAGERWYALLNASVRPFGVETPWYVGTGVALTKRESSNNVTIGRTSELTARHSIITGLRARWGMLRPFLEVRGLNVFQTDLTRVFVVPGVSVAFGPL